MKRKQAGGRLPATAALHEEEAGSRQGGVLVQDVNRGAGVTALKYPPQLVSLPAVVLFSLDAKPGLSDGEPGLSVLRPERRKAERGASIRLLVVHSRGSPM